MSEDLRTKAEKVSLDMGFSSIQEVIRVLLSNLSANKLKIEISNPDEPELSPKAKGRFAKIMKEIAMGKGIYKPKNDKEFFEMLNS